VRHQLIEWSQPAVREVVEWALPTLERRRADALDNDMRGDELAGQFAAWVADEVKEFRRLATAGALPTREAGEPTLAAARQALLAELAGLGRLQPLLDDEQVNDIHVLGHDTVFVLTADGRKESMPPIADSDGQLIERIKWVATRDGVTARSWDLAHPTLDLRLASGHRLSAVMAITPRPTITIRRPSWTLDRLDQFVAVGTVSEELGRFLGAAVRARLNIVLAGGQGAGKTTLMRGLLNEVSPVERIVTAEDARELRLDELVDADGQRLHPDVVALETRTENSEGAGRFTLADCLHLAKRLNPDRVVVGEVRSVEAGQMVDAMLGSAGGSMCTVHASGAHQAIGRLRSLMTLHGTLSEQAALELLTDAVDLVVYQEKEPTTGRRYVRQVAEVGLTDGHATFHDIFLPTPDGRAVLHSLPHHLAERLRPFGYAMPASNGQVVR
jgi:Flp pilus assembly CpaF family ATPase